jgi:hypothetical protein
MWKEGVAAHLKQCPGFISWHLGNHKERKKNFCRDGQCPGKDKNPRSLKYEAKALTSIQNVQYYYEYSCEIDSRN